MKPFPLKDKVYLAQSLHGISWPRWDWGPWNQDTQIDLFLTPDTDGNSKEKLYSFFSGRNIISVFLQQELVPGLKRRLKSNLGSDQCSDCPWRQKPASPSSSLLCQDQAFMVPSLIDFEYYSTSTKRNPTGEVAIALPEKADQSCAKGSCLFPSPEIITAPREHHLPCCF